MLSGGGAPNKARTSRSFNGKETPFKIRCNYRKTGISAQATFDDSSRVNVHGILSAAWIKLAMLALNLAVWLDAAVQVAR